MTLLIISSLLCSLLLSSSYRTSPALNKPLQARLSILKSTSSKYNALEDEINLELLEKVSKRPPPNFSAFDPEEAIGTLMAADVGHADVFWESTLPRFKKRRQAAMLEGDTLKRLNVDKSFYSVMDVGFQRRFAKEVAEIDSESKSSKAMASLIPKIIAKRTSDQLELRKTKEEQLKDLKRRQMMKRSGLMKLVPQELHKYIDYLVTLRKDPVKNEIPRNFVVAAIFAFITMTNARPRMGFLYSFLGNVAIMSILLTRNMPKIDVPLGMDRRRVVNWSNNAFNTAVAITALFAVPSALATFGLCSLLAMSAIVKARIAMAASIFGAAYFTAFFEVFEEKSKNGWRWKKAMEGTLTEDTQERLRREVFGKENSSDLFDFAYDPQVDEFPPQPKYVDERDMLIFGPKKTADGADSKQKDQGGTGDVDEDEANEHFQNWREQRKDARRAPIMDVEPETPWVGSRKGMYVQNIPVWLNTAYQKNVLKANKWRGKPTKFVKDNTEFEPIVGPVGFRDKQPSWLQDLFSAGIWEEKITASRKAARAFGSYRKTMWKIDKEVQLQPCDGADK